MVPPDSTGISRAPAYSGTSAASLPRFRIRDSHPLRSAIPGAFRYRLDPPTLKPHNPGTPQGAPVWALPLSLAATQGISFDFFSSGYLDVSVPRVGSLSGDRTSPAGFPHSDISGSSLACSSPKLFAACHVLLRRLVPRHPPCALIHLTSNTFAFSAQDFVGLPRSSVDAQQCASFLARRPPTPASETARSCLMAVGRWSLRDFAPFPHTRFTVS